LVRYTTTIQEEQTTSHQFTPEQSNKGRSLYCTCLSDRRASGTSPDFISLFDSSRAEAAGRKIKL